MLKGILRLKVLKISSMPEAYHEPWRKLQQIMLGWLFEKIMLKTKTYD